VTNRKIENQQPKEKEEAISRLYKLYNAWKEEAETENLSRDETFCQIADVSDDDAAINILEDQ